MSVGASKFEVGFTNGAIFDVAVDWILARSCAGWPAAVMTTLKAASEGLLCLSAYLLPTHSQETGECRMVPCRCCLRSADSAQRCVVRLCVASYSVQRTAYSLVTVL
jgi:hypothetical protein